MVARAEFITTDPTSTSFPEYISGAKKIDYKTLLSPRTSSPLSKEPNQLCLPSEELLKRVNVLQVNEQLQNIRRIFDSRQRSESWIYGYDVRANGPEGEIRKLIRERNTVSFGFDLVGKTDRYRAKTEFLASIGIPTLKIYGQDRATLYQEFIEEDFTKEAFRLMRTQPTSPIALDLVDQVTSIAARLDIAGFNDSRCFLSDLLFDANRGKFVMIDAGEDLGDPSSIPTDRSYQQLLQAFPAYQSYLVKAYEQALDSIGGQV